MGGSQSSATRRPSYDVNGEGQRNLHYFLSTIVICRSYCYTVKHEREFFSRPPPMRHALVVLRLVVLRSVIHRLRKLCSLTLELIEFGYVHKLYPLNRIVRRPIPAVRQLVTEIGLMVCQYTVGRRQYDRLSQQQLSFLLLLSIIGRISRAHSIPHTI